MGQEDDDMQIRNNRTGLLGQDPQYTIPSIGRQDRTPVQDCQDWTSRTLLQGQNSQSGFCYDIALILAFILALNSKVL
jgi:hypothetical protein